MSIVPRPTMRRRIGLFLQVACLFLAASSILVGIGHFVGYSSVNIAGLSSSLGKTFTSQPALDTFGNPLKNGNSTFLKLAPPYIKAIMAPEDVTFPRLECPTPTGHRYEYLRVESATVQVDQTLLDAARPKYFFALNLHQCAELLPRLVGSIVETMHFLGPKNCALSIVEGRSEDGTYEILNLLRERIEGIGAQYHFSTSDAEPQGDDRTWVLADLRNRALKPLIEDPREHFDNTTVIFLNDVSICMEDILELIHQRLFQKAEMVCGMDWKYKGSDALFNDTSVARGVTGDTFFDAPEETPSLFWNDPKSLARYTAHQPFQVFSCWNGGTVFTSRLLVEQMIRFRGNLGSECKQGEPYYFCKEMWHRGHGKIAVVPAVNLENSDEAARKVKELKGYVSQWVNKDGDGDDLIKIEWDLTPPPQVRCMTPIGIHTWLPWDYELDSFT